MFPLDGASWEFDLVCLCVELMLTGGCLAVSLLDGFISGFLRCHYFKGVVSLGFWWLGLLVFLCEVCLVCL